MSSNSSLLENEKSADRRDSLADNTNSLNSTSGPADHVLASTEDQAGIDGKAGGDVNQEEKTISSSDSDSDPDFLFS